MLLLGISSQVIWLLALNIFAYAGVAGLVAFGVCYALGVWLGAEDILLGSTYTGVFVGVLVGAIVGVTAFLNSRK